MSIADKITRLTTARDNIRTALDGKGIDASQSGFEDFADDINSIGIDNNILIALKDVSMGDVIYKFNKIEGMSNFIMYFPNAYLAQVDMNASLNLKEPIIFIEDNIESRDFGTFEDNGFIFSPKNIDKNLYPPYMVAVPIPE